MVKKFLNVIIIIFMIVCVSELNVTYADDPDNPNKKYITHGDAVNTNARREKFSCR